MLATATLVISAVLCILVLYDVNLGISGDDPLSFVLSLSYTEGQEIYLLISAFVIAAVVSALMFFVGITLMKSHKANTIPPKHKILSCGIFNLVSLSCFSALLAYNYRTPLFCWFSIFAILILFVVLSALGVVLFDGTNLQFLKRETKTSTVSPNVEGVERNDVKEGFFEIEKEDEKYTPKKTETKHGQTTVIKGVFKKSNVDLVNKILSLLSGGSSRLTQAEKLLKLHQAGIISAEKYDLILRTMKESGKH